MVWVWLAIPVVALVAFVLVVARRGGGRTEGAGFEGDRNLQEARFRQETRPGFGGNYGGGAG